VSARRKSDAAYRHRGAARELMIALWRYFETGLIPDGAMMRA
jgi:hypothetical protein